MSWSVMGIRYSSISKEFTVPRFYVYVVSGLVLVALGYMTFG